MSVRKSERGGSAISNIFWLAVLAAFAYACWNVLPVYFDHYSLTDKVLEATRKHPSTHKDDAIVAMLMRDVREMRLDPYIFPQNFRIVTRETSRQITLAYTREAQVLPGFKKVFVLNYVADQPFY